MTSQPREFEHAYLVLAHEDVAMINTLVSRLSKTGSVYIHIDKGSPINPEEILSLPQIHIFKEYKIKWGGWASIQATRFLADQAIDSGALRLTLLSGLSYPIVSDKRLEELTCSEIDIFDAGIVDLMTVSRAFKRRFTSRHLEFKLGNSDFARIVRRLSREFFALLPSLNPNRELSPLKLTLGSSWWSVTTQTYVSGLTLLEVHPQIKKYFKKIECSDESFFGTLFNAVSANNTNMGTTYVEWGNRGRPILLKTVDPELSRGFLFARKFNALTIETNENFSR